MKRLWTTFLGLCLSLTSATAFAQEGAPVAGGSYAGGGFQGGGGSFQGGGMPGGAYGGGGCASGNCGTGSCAPSCQKHHCPILYHCQEGGVHYKTHVGCPRPVCNPCMNPGWGYYETCWNPWPWPPDYSHCRVTPPAASIVLNPNAGPNALPPGHYQGDPNMRPQGAPLPAETRLAPPVQDRVYPQQHQGIQQGMQPMPRNPMTYPNYTYQQGQPVPTVPVATENPNARQQPNYNYQPNYNGAQQEAPRSSLTTESRIVPPMPDSAPQQPQQPMPNYAPRGPGY